MASGLIKNPRSVNRVFLKSEERSGRSPPLSLSMATSPGVNRSPGEEKSGAILQDKIASSIVITKILGYMILLILKRFLHQIEGDLVEKRAADIFLSRRRYACHKDEIPSLRSSDVICYVSTEIGAFHRISSHSTMSEIDANRRKTLYFCFYLSLETDMSATVRLQLKLLPTREIAEKLMGVD